MEELVPEAEGGRESVRAASERAQLLERDLHSSQQEMHALREEKEDMERTVGTFTLLEVKHPVYTSPSLSLSPSLPLQLEDRIAELQAGIAAAIQAQTEAQQQTSDHRLQLEALRDTQGSLQVYTVQAASPHH